MWDSVLLLAASLSRLIDSVYRPLAYNEEDWYNPVEFKQLRFRSIDDLRTSGTWCRRERRLIEDLGDGRLQELAFFSQIKREGDSTIYAFCSESACVAHQVSNEYRTHHTEPECRCELIQFERGGLDRNLPTSTREKFKTKVNKQPQAILASSLAPMKYMPGY